MGAQHFFRLNLNDIGVGQFALASGKLFTIRIPVREGIRNYKSTFCKCAKIAVCGIFSSIAILEG